MGIPQNDARIDLVVFIVCSVLGLALFYTVDHEIGLDPLCGRTASEPVPS